MFIRINTQISFVVSSEIMVFRHSHRLVENYHSGRNYQPYLNFFILENVGKISSRVVFIYVSVVGIGTTSTHTTLPTQCGLNDSRMFRRPVLFNIVFTSSTRLEAFEQYIYFYSQLNKARAC